MKIKAFRTECGVLTQSVVEVEAWKCRSTGKLFADEEAFAAHRREMASKRRRSREIARLRKKRRAMIDQVRGLSTFPEIDAWVIANLNAYRDLKFAEERITMNRRKNERGFAPFTVERFELARMQWDERVSNSHCAPEGKPTNWRGRDDLPTGYPGWSGYLHCKIRGGDPYWASDLLHELGIYTGTGGHDYGFDVKVFAEDFAFMGIVKCFEDSVST